MRKRKKTIIKHPLVLFLSLVFLVLFGGGTIMMHLDANFDTPNYVNATVGISLGIFSAVSLIYFFKNFNKIIRTEQKTKINKLKESALNNKPFVLVKEKSVVANIVFVSGIIFVFFAWLVLIPSPQFNHISFWIFRIVSILIIILGAIFSFVTPKKLLTYENGQLIVYTDGNLQAIKPSDLVEIKRNLPKMNSDKKLNIGNYLYSDIIICLKDREIVLKKVNSGYFLSSLIKTIKEIEIKNNENK